MKTSNSRKIGILLLLLGVLPTVAALFLSGISAFCLTVLGRILLVIGMLILFASRD